MRRLLFTLLALMLTTTCFSERNLSSLIKNLRKSGVDSIITLEIANLGSWGKERITNDTCSPSGYYANSYFNTYVVWKKNGKCYLTKVHRCINYKPVRGQYNSLFSFLNKYISVMQKETIRPQGYGQDRVVLTTEGKMIRSVCIYLKNKVVKYKFQNEDLTEKTNSKNLKYNLQLKQVKFASMLIKELKKANIGMENKEGLYLW